MRVFRMANSTCAVVTNLNNKKKGIQYLLKRLDTISGASTGRKNEVNTYPSSKAVLTLKILGLGAGWVGIL